MFDYQKHFLLSKKKIFKEQYQWSGHVHLFKTLYISVVYVGNLLLTFKDKWWNLELNVRIPYFFEFHENGKFCCVSWEMTHKVSPTVPNQHPYKAHDVSYIQITPTVAYIISSAYILTVGQEPFIKPLAGILWVWADLDKKIYLTRLRFKPRPRPPSP